MQGKKNSNAQISGRKATSSRMGTQQNLPQPQPQNQSASNNSMNAIK